MAVYVALHQYEIRYKKLLDFRTSVRSVVAPFTKIAEYVEIENEGTQEERIVLNFNSYQIVTMNDRMFIRSSREDTLTYNKATSVVKVNFFAMFEKIKALESFGGVVNTLFYSIMINPVDCKMEELLERFQRKYLNDEVNSLLKDQNDLSITLEKLHRTGQIAMTFGPFKGIEDLTKRKINIIDPEFLQLFNSVGFMLEYKNHSITQRAGFTEYKEMFEHQKSTINKWES